MFEEISFHWILDSPSQNATTIRPSSTFSYGMTRRISLSPHGLQTIRDRYPNDFTFYMQEVSYSCPSFIAEVLSPRVRQLRLQDPTVAEIELEIADPSGFFNDVISIGFGEEFELEIDSARLKFHRAIFSELWNSELFEMTFSKDPDISRGSVIYRIKSLERAGQNYDNEAALVAKHFYDFSASDFEDLGVCVLDRILGNPDLIVDSEDALFGFLRNLIESDPSSFRLLEHLRFDFLSASAITSFVELVSHSFAELTIGIWEQVGIRLARTRSPPDPGPRYLKLFSPEPDAQYSPHLDSKIIATFPADFEFFRGKSFALLYRGSRDGFESSAFHSRCDGHGETVTIIVSDNDCIFGGYSPCTWSSVISVVPDPGSTSFLFTIKNVHNLPARVFKLKHPENGICTNPGYGPCFGSGNDLSIGSPCTGSNKNWSSLGGAYENDTRVYSLKVLAGSYRFAVRDIEVFKLQVSPRC
jgi:hypothetical protein